MSTISDSCQPHGSLIEIGAGIRCGVLATAAAKKRGGDQIAGAQLTLTSILEAL